MTDLDQGRAAPVVHRLQRGLAAAAAAIALPVTAWGVQMPGSRGFFVVTCLVAVVPLLLLREPKGFVTACVTVGVLLLGWGVLGVFFGMFLFWPSALLLLFAALADPRRRPVTAKVVGGVGAAVTAAALVGCVAFAWHFYVGPALAEPHTFRAETDSEWFRSSDLGDIKDRLKPFGATDATGTGSDEGSYLDVRFPDQLSGPERDALKKEIAQLPGIVRVDLCPVSECG
ncbi:hypothetical protein [Streptomyces sp. NPDC051909]|uniref:hypothetical protein n=1 Tax=Streptomyces sp. NPDC051909 TaxID=3154944 RepID=UPI003431B015